MRHPTTNQGGTAMTELRLREADLHWREIDDDVIALETRESVYLAADGAGAILWRALARGATRDALADELVSAYGIERDRALADTDGFVDQLAEHGLLDR
jgi:hypothetical protein